VTRSHKRTKDVVPGRVLVRPMRLAARWESLSAPSDPLATIGGRGPTSKGKGEEEKKGRGKGRGLPPLFNCDYGPIGLATADFYARIILDNNSETRAKFSSYFCSKCSICFATEL